MSTMWDGKGRKVVQELSFSATTNGQVEMLAMRGPVCTSDGNDKMIKRSG